MFWLSEIIFFFIFFLVIFFFCKVLYFFVVANCDLLLFEFFLLCIDRMDFVVLCPIHLLSFFFLNYIITSKFSKNRLA